MLLLLETNFLHLILPVAFLLVRVGWPPPLARTHPFHRGEGGWWVMTMTMAGGVGGGPIYIYIYVICYKSTLLGTNHMSLPKILFESMNFPAFHFGGDMFSPSLSGPSNWWQTPGGFATFFRVSKLRFVCPTLRFLDTMKQRTPKSALRLYEHLGRIHQPGKPGVPFV